MNSLKRLSCCEKRCWEACGKSGKCPAEWGCGKNKNGIEGMCCRRDGDWNGKNGCPKGEGGLHAHTCVYTYPEGDCWESCKKTGQCSFCGEKAIPIPRSAPPRRGRAPTPYDKTRIVQGKCCRSDGHWSGQNGCREGEGGDGYFKCVYTPPAKRRDCYDACFGVSGPCDFCGFQGTIKGKCCRKTIERGWIYKEGASERDIQNNRG